MGESTATINYTTHRGRSVSLYNVPYDELGEQLRRLWQARIPAFAHDRFDIEYQVGGVDQHPETGVLTWWYENRTAIADPRLLCPSCGTVLDDDGYCTDVACERCGKATVGVRS